MSDGGHEESAWIRRYQPTPGAARRLVCFPHAGGSATFFRPLALALSGAVDVVAVQYPGRQDRRADPLIDSIPRYADTIAEALAGWTDLPLHFFGHSMGAILAFEVALRFQREDIAVAHLFASGRSAPSVLNADAVHRLGDDALLKEMAALGGTDQRLLVDDELLRGALPAIRSDYKAIETYRCAPGAVLNCPITVLTGNDDSRVSQAGAAAWSRHTTAGTRFAAFPGGHFFLSDQLPAITTLITTEQGLAPHQARRAPGSTVEGEGL
ncbi:thioesterase II family protein [Kitasatospora sp. NPDC058162]|uniref:thioesterase II family protein n=1 Tax=Kitasatospora sp. NPDC058162 TaxID=3346362 RepID=UPI0036DEB898